MPKNFQNIEIDNKGSDFDNVRLSKPEQRDSIQQQGDNVFLEKGSFRSPYFVSGKQGWSIDSNGNAEFRNLKIGGKTIAVDAGQNIQAAIDDINNSGLGGTVILNSGTHTIDYDITLYSKVSLIGSGKDQTILEFSGNANGIVAKGVSGTIKNNMYLADFTLQNSNNTAGIDIDYFDFFRIENVRVTSCDQNGIKIINSQNFSIQNTRTDTNTGNGFDTSYDSRSIQNFLININSDNNTGNGFDITSGSSNGIFNGVFLSCSSESNTGDGFDINGGNYRNAFIINSCQSVDNDGIGYDIDLSGLVVNSCVANSNGVDNFEITQSDNIFTSNNSIDTIGSLSGSLWDFQSERNISNNNDGISSPDVKKIILMKNTSGGTLNNGSIVIYKSVATGDEITTTTTQGDDKVFGVVLGDQFFNDNVSNGNFARILVEGKTTQLKVDGTTDIAIGDFLCTFTSAGIAAKAGSGDMAFAIALEAYTSDDSNGVIDALLITPRKI